MKIALQCAKVSGRCPLVLTVITVGALVLLALSIVCFAAYRINARKFEFSTAIWKFASMRITILSAPDEDEPSRPRAGPEP